jgi:Uma2 family endonuclease
MSIAVEASSAESLADVLERLGGVAPERIRMHPPPGTATVDDVVRIEQRENRLYELVDGVLVEKIMGTPESRIAMAIGAAIEDFIAADDMGIVVGADGMFRLPANLVRMPDVAYASWDHFPSGELEEAVPEVAPDLAVEVLSPGNTPGEMSRKLREYFRAGVRLVWFVDPAARLVTVYTSPTRSKVVPLTGTLDGGKVLPGFELPVASLFAKLKRKKRT